VGRPEHRGELRERRRLEPGVEVADVFPPHPPRQPLEGTVGGRVERGEAHPADRVCGEQGGAVGRQRASGDLHRAQEPALEPPPHHPAGQRGGHLADPRPFVRAEQLVLTILERGALRVGVVQPGQPHLDANELRPHRVRRVPPLVEVVGVDEPGGVVVGGGADGAEERGV
jgi:hypothetical protein